MRSNASRPKLPEAHAVADYTFRQRFRVPAARAFRWCLEFTPEDLADPPENGRRKVGWISPQTVVLDDSFPGTRGRRVRKVKLVQIYPESQSWVSTHFIGPRRHSQFRYRIVPDGASASALIFEGRELRWDGPKLSPSENRRLAKRLCAEDAALWKSFALKMERDLAGP